MYGKLFESIYDGTLYGKWEAIVTMQQLIVLASADGVIDMTPAAIAGKTSIPLEIIEKGLGILSEPDPHSRTPGSEGVRIQLLDNHRNWGWFLVNHEKYKNLKNLEDKRKADRDRIADKRKSLKDKGVAKCRKVSRMSQHIDEDEDEDEDEDGRSTTAALQPTDCEFETFKKAYPKRAGSQPWSRARKAIHARLKHGNTMAEILAGTKRYRAYAFGTDKDGTEFVLQAATFCGPEKHFLQPWELPATDSSGKTKGQIETGKRFMANTEEQP